MLDPNHLLFDQIRVRAYNWGDEPSETLHVDIAKKKRYAVQRRLSRFRLLQRSAFVCRSAGFARRDAG